jgi:xylulokinase
MFIGIDIGTSGVKTILVDAAQRVLSQSFAPLQVSRPYPMWAEQDPAIWWDAVDRTMQDIKAQQGPILSGVKSIGLSGQMLGATLLDNQDRILRPCILWNDGRSKAEGEELQRRVPEMLQITGNLGWPGFTAPKLIWLQRHEPDVFRRIAKVLMPKDYIRLLMTGDYATDMSDASGTHWLDLGRRQWSDPMLAATDLQRSHMPELFEGSDVTGKLLPVIAQAWGLGSDVVVAGGAGDNSAGGIGVGVIGRGDASLSLGTSGVFFVGNDVYAPKAAAGIHGHCHCLPGIWCELSVVLSAASCLSWVSHAVAGEIPALLAEIEADPASSTGSLIFLPYLSGERTPHNDPNAMGVFFGLTFEHKRRHLVQAVLEGVAFAFADGVRVLQQGGVEIGDITVIGGGARSLLWGRILASALNLPLSYRQGGDIGPAHGAARLARLAYTGERAVDICTKPPIDVTVAPDPARVDSYRAKSEIYRQLYRDLKSSFAQAVNL